MSSDDPPSGWSSARWPAGTICSSGRGRRLAVLGLILFVIALAGGSADRAWQLFHVNWLYFTGLATEAWPSRRCRRSPTPSGRGW